MSEGVGPKEEQPIKSIDQLIDKVLEIAKEAGDINAEGRIAEELSDSSIDDVARSLHDPISDMASNLSDAEQEALLTEARERLPEFQYNDQILIEGGLGDASDNLLGWQDLDRMRAEGNPDYPQVRQYAVADLAERFYTDRLHQMEDPHLPQN